MEEPEKEVEMKSHNSMAKAISKLLKNVQIRHHTSHVAEPDKETVRRKRKRVPEGSESGEEGASTVGMDVVEQCHRLPRDTALEEERTLQRVATQAVVQLFNAVSKHQKEIKVKEAGQSEHKKAKILLSTDKKDFINHLTNQKMSAKSVSGVQERADPSWSVLRDDFVKTSKLKDWDRVESIS